MPIDLKGVDFGNEAADDVDPADLKTYFVKHEDFEPFASGRNNFLIATARKGVGKSALLRWISHKVSESEMGALVVTVRGADLVRNRFHLETPLQSPNDHINDWMTRICAVVNRRLASEVGLAFTDDKISMVEMAEIEGYKSRNLVGCLLERLQSLLESGRHIKKLPTANEQELSKRIAAKEDRPVWILVDDLDATYQSTKEESLSLATFFSACRYLVQDIKALVSGYKSSRFSWLEGADVSTLETVR